MLGSTLQGEAQGGRSPWAFPFGKTQGSLPGSPSEASPCRMSNQFGSTGGVCHAWLPPGTAQARRGVAKCCKNLGVVHRLARCECFAHEFFRAAHYGPVYPEISRIPEIPCGAMGLKMFSLDFLWDNVTIEEVSSWVRRGAGPALCLVVFMRRLHKSVDWTQYGRQVMPLASGYPLDGLWAHGAGDHATRSAPACRLLASAGRNGRSASPAITATLLSLPLGFPAIALW